MQNKFTHYDIKVYFPFFRDSKNTRKRKGRDKKGTFDFETSSFLSGVHDLARFPLNHLLMQR